MGKRRKSEDSRGAAVRDLLFTLLVLILTLAICLLLQSLFQIPTLIPTIFVLGAFLVALRTRGYVWGIAMSLASVLAVNFAFTFPYYSFDFLTPENLSSALVMLIIAVTTSTMTTKIKAQEQLRAEGERERTRANLLRAISHDLRTPLTTIQGSCSAIIENYDSLTREQQLNLLRGIQSDSEWLIRMVENLLSVTRIGGTGVHLRKTPTVLEELIDAVLVRFHKQHPGQPVSVSIPDAFISISMDALLIQQVLMNLLENAVLHASGMTELVLSVETEGEQAVFSVADNGCGIPREKLGHLFTGDLGQSGPPADGQRSRMGIGLSVCAAIVRAHGGELQVSDRPGGGTVFRFALKMEASADEQQPL